MKKIERSYNKIISAILIAAVAFATVFCAWRFGIKNLENSKYPGIGSGNVVDGNGGVLDDGEYHDLPSNIVFAATSLNADPASSVMTAKLVATITPSSASDKTVDWGVKFKNGSSAWANGKSVSDYVTITPTADGALTATATCKQAFGEQILITVTSRDNAKATATCTVDYMQKIAGVNVSLLSVVDGSTVLDKFSFLNYTSMDSCLHDGAGAYVKWDVTLSSAYTIALADDKKIFGVDVKFSDELNNALKLVPCENPAYAQDWIYLDNKEDRCQVVLFDHGNSGWTTNESQIKVVNAIRSHGAGGVIVTIKNKAGEVLTTKNYDLDISGLMSVNSIALDRTTLTF